MDEEQKIYWNHSTKMDKDLTEVIIFHTEAIRMLKCVREYYIAYLLKYSTPTIHERTNKKLPNFNKVSIHSFTTDRLSIFAETVARTIDDIILEN